MEYRDLAPAEMAEESLRTIIHQSKDGEVLPAERDLVDEIGVSRTTLRSSLDRLSREGFLKTHARGTVVNQKLTLNMLAMSSMTEELQAGGKTVDVHVIASSLQAGPTAAREFFQEAADSKLFKLVRGRIVDGEPVTYEVTYLSASQFPNVEQLNLESVSLYDSLEEKYGTRPSYGREELSAVLADDILAAALHIEEQTPLFKVRSLTYDENDHPFEFSTQYLVGSKARYIMQARNIFDYQEDEVEP